MLLVLLTLLSVQPAVERAGRVESRHGRPKKPEKKPDKKPPPTDPPLSAPCPDGKPATEEMDQFFAGDATAAKKVKAYAGICHSFAASVAKDLYLRGYTLKDYRPADAIELFKRTLDIAPANDEFAEKARAQIAKLKTRRD